MNIESIYHHEDSLEKKFPNDKEGFHNALKAEVEQMIEWVMLNAAKEDEELKELIYTWILSELMTEKKSVEGRIKSHKYFQAKKAEAKRAYVLQFNDIDVEEMLRPKEKDYNPF